MPTTQEQRLLAAFMSAKQAKGANLCHDEILTVSRNMLEIFREEWGRAKKTVKKKTEELNDADWVKMLEGEPHLQGIDIKREINACQFWCKNNKKLPTRRRIINWLNKAERVVDLKATGATYASGLKPVPPMPPEPTGWRETFPDFIYVNQKWENIERTAQIYIADQMKQRIQA